MEDNENLVETLFYQLRSSNSGLTLQKRKKRQCFQGSDLIAWIDQNMNIPKGFSEQVCQNLLDELMIRPTEDESNKNLEIFSPSNFYHFFADEEPKFLNCIRIFSGYIRSISDILNDIQKRIQSICSEFLSVKSFEDRTKPIDYNALEKSLVWKKFVSQTVELQMIQPSFLLKAEKEILAFFINIYNILCFHINVEKIRPQNRFAVFQRVRYDGSKFGYLIGGQKFTISDIENGILRGARKSSFSRNDARRALLSTSDFDPRIHFLFINSINEGTGFQIDEPIRIYTKNNITAAMQNFTQIFCNSDEIQVNVEKKTITLPWIFREYKKDFGNDSLEVVEWISNFTSPPKKTTLLEIARDVQGIIQFNSDPEENLYRNFSAPVLNLEFTRTPSDVTQLVSLDIDPSNYFKRLHNHYNEEINKAKQLIPEYTAEKGESTIPIHEENKSQKRKNIKSVTDDVSVSNSFVFGSSEISFLHPPKPHKELRKRSNNQFSYNTISSTQLISTSTTKSNKKRHSLEIGISPLSSVPSSNSFRKNVKEPKTLVELPEVLIESEQPHQPAENSFLKEGSTKEGSFVKQKGSSSVKQKDNPNNNNTANSTNPTTDSTSNSTPEEEKKHKKTGIKKAIKKFVSTKQKEEVDLPEVET